MVARRQIVLCGSMTFYEQMQQIKGGLEQRGAWVISPSPDEINLNKLSADEYRAYKREISFSYIRQIKNPKTYGVLIVNIDKHGIPNYIGPNSFAELAVAVAHGKAAFLLSDYPDIYADELKAWNVIALNGQLDELLSKYTDACMHKSQQLEFNI